MSIVQFVSRKIRDLRIGRGFSQEELAHRAGVHRTYIGMVERAEKNITITSLEKITTALGVKVSEIFEGYEDE